MWAPPGWNEPAQSPEFDETVCVLEGALTVVVDGKKERIRAGQVGFVPRGKRVVYRNDGKSPCAYFSVCAPAFRFEKAHVEPPLESNEVVLEVGHPKGKAHGKRLAKEAKSFLAQLGLTGQELSLSIVTDRTIRRVNRTWRGKDKPTDVLSFPGGEPVPGAPGPSLMGDVVISLDTAVRQAKAFGRPLEEELRRYLAHGILHLLGHDHEEEKDAARMSALEGRLLGGDGMIRSAQLPPSGGKRPARAGVKGSGKRPRASRRA
jgi:probable rRNA maturation factor